MSDPGSLFDSWRALEEAEQQELTQFDNLPAPPPGVDPYPLEPAAPPSADPFGAQTGLDPRDASRMDQVDMDPDEYLLVLEETQRVLIEAGIDGLLVPTGDPEELENQRRLVDGYAREALARQVSTFAMAVPTRDRIVNDLVNDILGLGPMEHLIQDPEVTEVIVRGMDHTSIERSGKLQDVECRWRSQEHVRAVAQRIVGRIGRKVDEADPMCDARLPDGSRVNVILPPVSLIGPIITIRKFQPKGFSLDELQAFGAFSQEMHDFMVEAVEARVNILVSGSTGSGKTTLLKALSYKIPGEEYVVTIEDTDELRLKDVHPRVSPLEARPSNASGAGEVSIRRLLRNSLRMRPDRIVVGECRGAEALDMLQAMNTGHEGSLTTCHANSVRDAVMSRIPTMAAMSNEVELQSALLQTIGAIELGVQVERARESGQRLVSQIVQIEPTDDPARPEITVLWRHDDGGWERLTEPSGRLGMKLAAQRKRSGGPPQDLPVTEKEPAS